MPIVAKGQRLPGIVDVANRASVSPATVSRCFNTPEIVSLKTRTRVQAAAEELGYVRNRLAGTLLHRPSGTIGLVVPTLDNAIFAQMIQAFATALLAESRTLVMATHGYDTDLEEILVRSLLEQRVDAIALIGLDHSLGTFKLLERARVPVLLIWNYDSTARLPCVGVSNHEAGRIATRHVLDLGHRDIALVFPDTRFNDRARERRAAALNEIRTLGLHILDHRMATCPYETGKAKQTVLAMLADRQRPSAIICGNDVIAHGAIYAAQALGLRVPRDLSIVGIGDFHGSADIEPGLTTVRIPARAIGRSAAEVLLEALRGNAGGGAGAAARSIQIQPHLIERHSTATHMA